MQNSGSARLALVASMVVGCGGQVEPSPHPDASVFPAGVIANTPSSLGPVLDVTEGEAIEGYWYVDRASKTIRPETRCFDGIAKKFWVAPFRMMKWEVTNGAYKACVDEGACAAPGAFEPSRTGNPDPAPWDAPSKRKKPAAVGYRAARAFCQHYGGDVPSAAQWNRAAAGDDLSTFGIPSLTAALLTCLFDHRGPLCDEFARSASISQNLIPPFVLTDAGATSWDVGPFGHQDLFANAAEWTRTAQLTPDDRKFCALPDDSPDQIAVGPELPNVQTVRQIAALLEGLVPLPGPDDPHLNKIVYPGIRVDEPTYFTGFRCAFPR